MRSILLSISKFILFSVFFALIIGIIGAVFGELFIEYAKEKGAYEKPSEKIGNAMTWVFNFVTSTGFLISLAAIIGLCIGVLIDQWAFRTELNADIKRLEGELGDAQRANPRLEQHLANSSDEIKEYINLITMIGSINLPFLKADTILMALIGLPMKAQHLAIDGLTSQTREFCKCFYACWCMMYAKKNSEELPFSNAEMDAIVRHYWDAVVHHQSLCKAVLFNETTKMEELRALNPLQGFDYPHEFQMKKNQDDVEVIVRRPTVEAP